MKRKYIGLFVVIILGISLVFAGCSSRVPSDELLYEEYEDYEDEDYEDYEDEDEDYIDEDYENEDNNDQGDSPSGDEKSMPNVSVIGSVNNIKLELQKYQLPGVFTLSKPKGWSVYKAGEYNTIAFLARDDKEPLRQVFCFSEIGLFYVDQNQKDLEWHYQTNGGYPIQWIDMPVIYPFDGTTFYNNFNSILESQIARSFLTAANMPKPAGFDRIEIISEEPIQSILPGIPATLVRALLIQNENVGQGMFVVSGIADGLGHGTALMVTGISAPIREFSTVQNSLLDVVRSFELEPAYAQEGMRVIQQNGERLAQISKTLSETSDIITKGWTERSRADDIRIEKNGDHILGVERVYDPDTGEVYEVKNGFYDYYRTHENEYSLNNLQPLPDNDTGLWGKAPRINHGLVSP